jgi:hypothetical protein
MATEAPACRAALTEATTLWPNRNRASDGILGDAAHQATPSDHNLGNAYDLTHDPAHGVDCAALAEQVKDDPRTKYVIFDRRISTRTIDGGRWRPYAGQNPHTSHMHVSIYIYARNDTSPWFVEDEEDNRMVPEDKKLVAAFPYEGGYVFVTADGAAYCFGCSYKGGLQWDGQAWAVR